MPAFRASDDAFPSGSGISGVGAAAMMSSSVPFSILELTGLKRLVTLRERALPFQGIEFPGKMRVETTRYSGNPIATQQVMGSEEGSTTFTGVWNDRFVGPGNYGNNNYPPISIGGILAGSLYQIVATIDDIRRQGQQIQMTWGQVTRVGVMTSFVPKWDRPVDVSWSMTFEWASQGEAQPPNGYVAPSIADTQAQFQQSANSTVNQLQLLGVINPPPQTPPNPFAQPSLLLLNLYSQAANAIAAPAEFVNAVNGYVQNAYSAVNSVSDLAGQVADLAATSTQVALKIAALCSYAIDQYSGIEFELDSRPAIYFYNVDLPPPTPPGPVALPIASITPAQMITAESSARQSRQAARNGRLAAAVERATYAAQANPSDMISVFVSSNNQDLRRVSTQFYGSPDSWRDLARYNDLPNSGLTAGQLIFVPSRPPTTTAQGIPQATGIPSSFATNGQQ